MSETHSLALPLGGKLSKAFPHKLGANKLVAKSCYAPFLKAQG